MAKAGTPRFGAFAYHVIQMGLSFFLLDYDGRITVPVLWDKKVIDYSYLGNRACPEDWSELCTVQNTILPDSLTSSQL